MEEMLHDLLDNRILISSILAWAAAQIIKTIIAFVKHGEFDAERLFGAGGMPSSHTALVVALTVSSALIKGLGSSEFAISFILACIVMYDAAGVRQAAGNQARVLNKLIRQLRIERTVGERELKELLGHTPMEVLGGAVLGLTIAVLIV